MGTFKVAVRSRVEVEVIDYIVLDAESSEEAEKKAVDMIWEGTSEPVDTEVDWQTNSIVELINTKSWKIQQ